MSTPTLIERIEAAFDRAIEARSKMDAALYLTRNLEAAAKADHADEWASAKNNDVRAVLLAGWLSGNEQYSLQREAYLGFQRTYRLALLEIERLKLLVEASKGEMA